MPILAHFRHFPLPAWGTTVVARGGPRHPDALHSFQTTRIAVRSGEFPHLLSMSDVPGESGRFPGRARESPGDHRGYGRGIVCGGVAVYPGKGREVPGR